MDLTSTELAEFAFLMSEGRKVLDDMAGEYDEIIRGLSNEVVQLKEELACAYAYIRKVEETIQEVVHPGGKQEELQQQPRPRPRTNPRARPFPHTDPIPKKDVQSPPEASYRVVPPLIEVRNDHRNAFPRPA